MKTTIKIIISLFFTTNIYAQRYVVEKDAVYYYDQIITGADASSFDAIAEDPYFSKDKNSIYYKGTKTKFDSETFKIHEKTDGIPKYYSDKNYVYNPLDQIIIRVDSQSPDEFRFLTKKIAIDNELIYWEFTPIFNSDASSFQIINSDIFKDKNHLYHQGNIMPITPKNMKILNRSKGYQDYVIDFIGNQNTVCDDYNRCFQMDTNSFQYINYNYVKDKSHVLCREDYLKADAATFKVPFPEIEHYAKDKYNQFYLGNTFPITIDEMHLKEESLNTIKDNLKEQLKVAFDKQSTEKYDKDSRTSLTTIFTFTRSNNTSIEKGKNIYMNGKRQEFIDAASFVIFNNDYAKDKKQVYLIYEYEEKVTFNPINGMDPNTFSIIENEYDAYSKDSKNVYHKFKKLEGADPNTFKVVNEIHAEDKNSVFINDKRLAIMPSKDVFAKEINDYYFLYGNKIIYIDDNSEVFIDNPNINSFKVFDSYAINKKKLIYKGKTIGSLAQRETIIESDDEKLITNQRLFLYGTNINTLKKNKRHQYFKSNYTTDGHALYYKNEVEIKGVDLTNIHHSFDYITFKNNKALYKDIVFNIDLETFEILGSSNYSRDKNYVYYKGVKTTRDPSTFYILGNYTSDKNGVYYEDKLLPEADPDSFYNFYNFGFDKTYFYYENKKILRSKVNLKH